MTLHQFNQLSEAEKANYIWDNGDMVAVRYNDDKAFLLYQLGAFYAEVVYRNEGSKIEFIDAFVSTGQLDPYLENIDISELL
ncbi:hypothetical protein EXU57_23430 [Segetibacter sp. 3557_3]|uniref:hypothetical protein n=1 Tax=Segetibacter sp. 3557_3 TaxID=2547429 RepID=UPI001058D666|nr:hypothetical protein [Segetibacter sp. 3557_3]TDH18418.1 hypothetical protein EXU57_23430 [Segetibacter sp. 3557_3]